MRRRSSVQAQMSRDAAAAVAAVAEESEDAADGEDTGSVTTELSTLKEEKED